MKKYRVLIIAAAALAVLVGIIILSFQPRQVLRRKFGYRLPKSAVILNFDYQLFGENLEEYLDCKISFDEFDYPVMKKQVETYYGKYGSNQISKDDFIPYFENTCPWWDMDKDDIVLAYERVETGRTIKSQFTYSFIVRDSAGEYYLYVSK